MAEILKLLTVLVGAPWLAFAFAGLFIAMYYFYRLSILRITAGSWLAYGIYEYLMYFRVLCSGDCNIRIDLSVIYPLLGILSFIALVRFAIHWGVHRFRLHFPAVTDRRAGRR